MEGRLLLLDLPGQCSSISSRNLALNLSCDLGACMDILLMCPSFCPVALTTTGPTKLHVVQFSHLRHVHFSGSILDQNGNYVMPGCGGKRGVLLVCEGPGQQQKLTSPLYFCDSM